MGERGPKQRPIPKALPQLRFSLSEPRILLPHHVRSYATSHTKLLLGSATAPGEEDRLVEVLKPLSAYTDSS